METLAAQSPSVPCTLQAQGSSQAFGMGVPRARCRTCPSGQVGIYEQAKQSSRKTGMQWCAGAAVQTSGEHVPQSYVASSRPVVDQLRAGLRQPSTPVAALDCIVRTVFNQVKMAITSNYYTYR